MVDYCDPMLLALSLVAIALLIRVIIREHRARLPTLGLLAWTVNYMLFQLATVVDQLGFVIVPIERLSNWSSLIDAQALATIAAISLVVLWDGKHG